MRQTLRQVRKLRGQNTLPRFFRGTFSLNEPLAAHTSLRIGGPARMVVMPRDVPDLIRLVRVLRQKGMRFVVLGAGTNVLVSDEYLSLSVIKLTAPVFQQCTIRGNTVFAGAGMPLAGLREQAQAYRLSGFEFLTGIPGTVGGALVMNAGVRGLAEDPAGTWHSMADRVIKVGVIDAHGCVALYSRSQIEFGYRRSSLKRGIVVGAWFELTRSTAEAIGCRTRQFFERKQQTQDFRRPNAGCMFKNPADASVSAGQLIEQCHLKGQSVGDAQVSNVHGNFIVNNGRACFREVKSLMEIMQQEVFQKFSVWLEPEVEIWDKEVRL